jgi:hypothetical protein
VLLVHASAGEYEIELATATSFAIRMGPLPFDMFHAYPAESGRQVHLSGYVAAGSAANASEPFAQPPVLEKVNVLTAKLPQEWRTSHGTQRIQKGLAKH